MADRKKKRLLSPRTGPQPKTLGDPVPAAKQSADVAAAVKVGEEILALMEDDVPEKARLDNATYFESVEEKTKGIVETVSRSNRVSEGQRNALDNMLAGVRRWTRDGRE